MKIANTEAEVQVQFEAGLITNEERKVQLERIRAAQAAAVADFLEKGNRVTKLPTPVRL